MVGSLVGFWIIARFNVDRPAPWLFLYGMCSGDDRVSNIVPVLLFHSLVLDEDALALLLQQCQHRT